MYWSCGACKSSDKSLNNSDINLAWMSGHVKRISNCPLLNLLAIESHFVWFGRAYLWIVLFAMLHVKIPPRSSLISIHIEKYIFREIDLRFSRISRNKLTSSIFSVFGDLLPALLAMLQSVGGFGWSRWNFLHVKVLLFVLVWNILLRFNWEVRAREIKTKHNSQLFTAGAGSFCGTYRRAWILSFDV